jgi:DNA-binding CsgD family transcriptional regulator
MPAMQVYVGENWVAQNPYLETKERIERFNEPRFLLDTEVMSAEEMRRNRYYQEFMRPYGVYWHAGTSITGPTGDTIKLSVHRSYDAGPLSPEVTRRLTVLRPHLARATLLTARLRFEQVRAAVEAFDIIGLPTAAIRRGRLALCNNGFEKLIPAVVRDRTARLAFAQASVDQRWSGLLAAGLSGGTFAVAAGNGFPAMIAHAVPMVGASRDVFNVADLLLIVASAERSADLDTKVLEGLFDLTAAEAAIARDLANGMTIASIAKARGASPNTVRVQVKSIFGKTGIHRQADLVRMLTGLPAAASPAK